MKTFRKAASLLLSAVLTALTLSVTVSARDVMPVGYKLKAVYDEEKNTIAASLAISGGEIGLGEVGVVYDETLIAPQVDGKYAESYKGASINSVVTCNKSVKGLVLSEQSVGHNLVNDDPGEVFFGWYLGDGLIDASKEDVDIVYITFSVKPDVTKDQLNKAGASLIKIADDVPTDEVCRKAFKSGAAMYDDTRVRPKVYRNLADAQYPLFTVTEIEGLDIEVKTKKVTVTAKDETGAPIEGVIVSVNGEEQVTDKDGKAVFEVPADSTPAIIYKVSEDAEPVALPLGETDIVISTKPEATKPAKMDKPTVTAGTESVTVQWTAPDDGGSAITEYTISLTYGSSTKTVTAKAGETSKKVTGLTGGAQYSIKIKAANEVGQGEFSDAVFATPKAQSSGGGGGGGGGSSGGIGGGSAATLTYTVTYDAGSYGTLNGAKTESVTAGYKPTKVPTITAKEGYEFIGWAKKGTSAIIEPKNTAIAASTTFVAQYREASKEDDAKHTPYIKGYSDGTILPEKSITRAEAVTIIARICPDFDENGTYASSFSDVAEGDWYAKYVGYCVSKGYVKGYSDGTFLPNNNITRAEFGTIIVRFLALATDTSMKFTDIPDANAHWSFEAVSTLYANGIITGYKNADGTRYFDPQRLITRAEVMSIINRSLGRAATAEAAQAYTDAHGMPGTDIRESDWYFADVVEAAAEHKVSDLHK